MLLAKRCSTVLRRVAASTRLPPSLPHPPTAVAAVRFVHIEKRIEELGLELPPPAPPRANYNSVCWSGDLVYVSGHLPFNTAGTELTKGRIGDGGRDVEYGYQAARQVALGLVATLKDQLGDLDRVVQVVKVCMCCCCCCFCCARLIVGRFVKKRSHTYYYYCYYCYHYDYARSLELCSRILISKNNISW